MENYRLFFLDDQSTSKRFELLRPRMTKQHVRKLLGSLVVNKNIGRQNYGSSNDGLGTSRKTRRRGEGLCEPLWANPSDGGNSPPQLLQAFTKPQNLKSLSKHMLENVKAAKPHLSNRV